jgi:hypothetical protein
LNPLSFDGVDTIVRIGTTILRLVLIEPIPFVVKVPAAADPESGSVGSAKGGRTSKIEIHIITKK